jgi:hypothetical protein
MPRPRISQAVRVIHRRPTRRHPACQDLRRHFRVLTIHSVQRRLPLASELPLRPQEETQCRRCGVHCDKVVYPAACVERACPFLYAYEELGRTYIGCMQKVYDVEIDLEALREAQFRKGGFGAVRTVRQPLPMCKSDVATCYENRADKLGCINPEFYELPRGEPPFRVVDQTESAA